MATEAEGYWAERTWLFMALCRQLGIDTGLVTYSKSNTLVYQMPRFGSNVRHRSNAQGSSQATQATHCLDLHGTDRRQGVSVRLRESGWRSPVLAGRVSRRSTRPSTTLRFLNA